MVLVGKTGVSVYPLACSKERHKYNVPGRYQWVVLFAGDAADVPT
jgi:hypothetical protein